MTVLGVDVGTTGVKAVAIGPDGTVLGRAERDYPLLTPEPGWAELDPRAVWSAARDVISRAVTALPEPPVAIGFSALGEAFLPVDERTRPLGNAIVSFDRRALREYEEAVAAGGAERIEAVTRIRPLPHHAAFKWLWWRRHRPDVYERTSAFIGLGSWVAQWLGASPAIDPSLAIRTALYDPLKQLWDVALAESLGISPGRLPTVLPSSASCGVVSEAAAARLGLRAGAPVIVGGLDQACGAYDLAVSGTRGTLTLGTTAVVCLSRPTLDAIPRLIPAVPHVDSSTWLAMAGTPAGGSTLRWFRDVVAVQARRRGADPGAYDRIVAAAAGHQTSVLFLPHLGGSRVAFDDPAAAGAFVGLTLATSQADLSRAVLDGVAYEIATLLRRLRDCGLHVTELRATGGGSRSREWMQTVADATGMPIESTASSDSAARGAARLATLNASAGTVSAGTTAPVFRVEPRAAWRDYHGRRLAQFMTVYEALRGARQTGASEP